MVSFDNGGTIITIIVMAMGADVPGIFITEVMEMKLWAGVTVGLTRFFVTGDCARKLFSCIQK